MLKIKDLKIPLYDISLFLFVLYMFRQSLWNADPLLRLIVPFFLAVSIYRTATKKIILKKELKYTLWIGAICGITWLVSMFSLYKEQSFSALQNMFRTGIYVSLILINCKEKKELDKVITYVWIAGITVVISLIQNFDPSAVALMDESYATSARLGFGGIEHPNTTAYNIYISFAMGVYLFIKYREIRRLKYLVLLGEIMLIVGCSFIASIATIHIGNHVMFGPNVTIRGGDHRTDIIGRYIKSVTPSEKLPENDKDVYIEDDVWIGCNVTILKGVRIGRGSVIGAGSIVVKDVPPYTIHVGCPAVFEKRRFTDEEIKQHEKILYDN